MNVAIVVYVSTIVAALIADLYLAVSFAISVPEAGFFLATFMGMLAFIIMIIPTSVLVYVAWPVAGVIGITTELSWWLGKKILFTIRNRRTKTSA